MDFTDCDQRLVAIGKELMKGLDNWGAWAAKADILCAMGMYEVAIRCCDKSLAMNPYNVLTWMTKSDALAKLGRHEEAQAAITEAKKFGNEGQSSN